MSISYFTIQNRFSWISTTDTEILESVIPTEFTRRQERDNKEVCFLSRQIVYTTEEENSHYRCSVYSLKNPEILENATVQEEFLTEDEHLFIHRIAVIRNGEIIDKTLDSIIRTFDHETQSGQGVIYNGKKINIVIHEVRATDILIYEVTRTVHIADDSILEKKYFYHSHLFPTGYWPYKHLEFQLINHRTLSLVGKCQFFRNDDGTKREEPLIKIPPGESYASKKMEYQVDTPEGSYQPGIEFATEASWENIGEDIIALYEPLYLVNWYDRPWLQELNIEDLSILEKIQKITEFVQNDINYIYDADFIHRHIPQNYDTTLAHRAGDCKAKSLLLKRILETIGVSCDIVLVNYAKDGILQYLLPSPFHFNHAIIKVAFSGESYFIDPTWKNYHGNILNRTEPLFEYYFTLTHGSTELGKRRIHIPKVPNIKDEIRIQLRGERSIDITTTYRYGNADRTRQEFSHKTQKELIDAQIVWLMETFSFGENPPNSESVLTNINYTLIEDDKSENRIKTHFHATLFRPFVDEDESIFRFYPYDIIAPTYYPEEIGYFYAKYSMERSIDIEFAKYVDTTDPTGVTLSNAQIDTSDLFYYTNSKTFPNEQSIHVETRFQSRYIGRIDHGQYDQLLIDIHTVNDSNNGVGAILLDTPPAVPDTNIPQTDIGWIGSFFKKR